MRVLIASTEGAGHFGPLVPFLDAAKRRGDDAVVVGPPGLAEAVAAAGCRFEVGADPPADELAALWRRVASATPAETSVLVNREIFGRLNTAAMLPTLERVCEDWCPDLIVREPCEYASAIAADRAGIPHAQVAISLARVESGSLDRAAPVLQPYDTGIVDKLRASPYLTRFPASLDPSPFPSTVRFAERPRSTVPRLPEWWGSDGRPLIYATLGSETGRRPIGGVAYRTVIDAVASLPARVLLTVGRDMDERTLGVLPPNVHVESWIDQHDVLPHAAAVVCHGGSGTTFAALAAGVPLVFLPLFADQPVNARLVSDAGAGISAVPHVDRDDARNALPSASRLRDAVRTVTTDPSYRRAACRIAEEMRQSLSLEDALDGTAVRPPTR